MEKHTEYTGDSIDLFQHQLELLSLDIVIQGKVKCVLT